MVDIVIKNGLVIDGSGDPGRKADLVISGNTIQEIGAFGDVQADIVIDAQGKAVAPGFIDMHSHADASLPFAPYAESLAYQGVTTVVTGQCGFSPAPLSPETKQDFINSLGTVGADLDFSEINSFGSILDYIRKKGISINMCPLVGQGTIRAAVMGYSSARPTEEQLEAMQRLAEQSMDEGAIGISTGLIYPPGYYTTTEELIEVVRPVAEKGGMYFSHVREEGAHLLDSIEEERRIAAATGIAVQHSHYKAAGVANWDNAARGLEAMEKVRAEGIDMTVDMYPYIASSNDLMDALPDWSREGGLEKTMQRLKDPASRLRIRQTMHAQLWDKMLISDSPIASMVGRYASDLAAEAGKEPFEWMCDVLLETGGGIGRIVFGMSEDNVKMQLQHELMMIGTDGYGIPPEGHLSAGAPHPRSFGTFPRVLGKYVREEKILTLEQGVHKMTGKTAQKLGWSRRGLLKPGCIADVVVFDPATIIDTATFTQPKQYPLGIEQVIVNGQFVIRNGKHTYSLKGQILGRNE